MKDTSTSILLPLIFKYLSDTPLSDQLHKLFFEVPFVYKIDLRELIIFAKYTFLLEIPRCLVLTFLCLWCFWHFNDVFVLEIMFLRILRILSWNEIFIEWKINCVFIILSLITCYRHRSLCLYDCYNLENHLTDLDAVFTFII